MPLKSLGGRCKIDHSQTSSLFCLWLAACYSVFSFIFEAIILQIFQSYILISNKIDYFQTKLISENLSVAKLQAEKYFFAKLFYII